VSGGADKVIYVHKPGETQPSHVLLGHEHNVRRIHCASIVLTDRCVHCMLATMEQSFQAAGTSMNCLLLRTRLMRSTARVWKGWECVYTLTGHDRAVWAVLALDNDEYLTGTNPTLNPEQTRETF
jgi:phospholipase A-2-activating protein